MVFAIQRLFMRAAAAVLMLAAGPPAKAQQVAAGPGAWSTEQAWAYDPDNRENLKGFFYWPASPPTLAGKRALVLVLHGCAQTAAADVINDSRDGGFNWKTRADQYGAVILAPNATGNTSFLHCWDYSHARSRTSGHSALLLDLVNRFVTNPQYAIDPNQVYVTGLSSGGGETMALGCMAPDVFAGIGINAGPPPGTTTKQIKTVPPGYTAATAAKSCKALAGSNLPKFSTQIAGVVWGSSDPVVDPAYGPLDAEAMRLAYGGTYTKGAAQTVAPGGTNISYTDSSGKLRTSEMSINKMLHAWPSGSGGQNGNYVDATRVNYPAFVMNFWFQNNLRASTVAAPAMTSCSASVAGNKVTVSGAGTDSAGSISSYKVVLSGATPVSDASFSKVYASMANGYYSGSVTASDSGTGLTSAPCGIAQFLVGPPPPIQPPAGLAAGAATASSIALSWSAAGGATGYNVYRNGARITATPVTTTSYTSTGLAAGTSYSFQVSSVGAGSVESA